MSIKSYRKKNKNPFIQKALKMNQTDLRENNKCIFLHLISMIKTSIMKKHFKVQNKKSKYNTM